MICLGSTSERPTSSTSREWPEAPKLARHVLGLANFDGGGLTAINKHFMDALNASIEHAQGEQALWEPARTGPLAIPDPIWSVPFGMVGVTFLYSIVARCENWWVASR